MARKTGITSKTPKRMMLDAGAIYVNYGEDDERLIGATRDGGSFEIEQEIREPEIDGARGPIKGTRRVVNEHARLTVNIIEMTAENFKAAFPGAYIQDGPDHDTVKRSLALSSVEHFKNVAWVGDQSGSSDPVIIELKNALSDDEVEIEFEDQNEAAMEVTFTAHHDPDDMDESPWEIRVPKLNENE